MHASHFSAVAWATVQVPYIVETAAQRGHLLWRQLASAENGVKDLTGHSSLERE